MKNIVAEVTFQFWVILDNYGQFLAILDNFGSFFAFFVIFWKNFGHVNIIVQGYLINHIFHTVTDDRKERVKIDLQ